MANWNAASISVLVVIFIDVILCIISLATDYWSDMEINLEGQSSKVNHFSFSETPCLICQILLEGLLFTLSPS